MRRPPPRLIAELIALTTADGRSVAELARELDIDQTTLLQYRSGRRPISMKTYARIVRRFGEHRLIRDLAVHYVAVEFHAKEQTAESVASPSIPKAVTRALTLYVERFPEESVHGGRGLYLTGADRSLSEAAQFVAQLFDSAKVPVCRLRADKKPAASEVRDALAAPLLIVERIDFLCDAVADLIRKRADLVRPIVVTSTQGADAVADPYLRRILSSSTRAISLENASEAPEITSPPQHATT